MPWANTRAGLHGLVHKSATISLSILLLYQSFVYSFSQSVHLTGEVASVPRLTKRLETNTTLQASHYVTNTYLRSDLRENQAGVPLLLQITVLDSRSCAPVENALIEIWAANREGQYSAENSDDSKSGCSSWLRGGSATDSEGVVGFKTIYPGTEAKRAPHLNAIIRSDWYEYANNSTIASDSAQFVTAIGQIFFPDDLNANVYKSGNYTDALTKMIKNDADPYFKAQNSTWKAEAQPSIDGQDGVISVQLTISIDLTVPQKIQVPSLGSQCSKKCDNPAKDTVPPPQPTNGDQNSAAAYFQPSMVVILMINMILIYNMYGRNASGGEKRREPQEEPQQERTTNF